MKCDYLVVGAGFFGCVLAERLANHGRREVVVVEKRSHVGGNCHSQEDPETCIEFHSYGTHIFHTSSGEVWDYITRFAEFNGYHHQVLTMHRGRVYQLPINLATINSFYDVNLTPSQAREFLQKQTAKESLSEPATLEQRAVSLIGRPLYEAFIRGYTVKQWGKDPRELPPEIFSRLPIRYNYDKGYFADGRWQGIPLEGYTRLFERMLDSPRIQVLTGWDYFDHRQEVRVRHKTIYSGPIDRYFGYAHGNLEWRSVRFSREMHSVQDFQGTAVMNFADLDVPYTRIHEPRHLHPERDYPRDKTLIFYELPVADADEPYYPVNTPANQLLLKQYLELAAREKHTIIGGRLGGYAYYDMDKTILSALDCYRRHFL